jgi:hypothetical protein
MIRTTGSPKERAGKPWIVNLSPGITSLQKWVRASSVAKKIFAIVCFPSWWVVIPRLHSKEMWLRASSLKADGVRRWWEKSKKADRELVPLLQMGVDVMLSTYWLNNAHFCRGATELFFSWFLSGKHQQKANNERRCCAGKYIYKITINKDDKSW